MRRYKIRQCYGATGGGHEHRVVIIFDDNGYAMQGTTDLPRLPFCIQSGGIIKGRFIDPNDAVEHGTGAVIGVNPVEIVLNQLHRVRLPRLQRSL